MADNDSEEYIQPKKTRRRSSSRNRKKTLSDNESSDSNSPIRPKKRRLSSRNKNRKIDLDLASSDSSDETPPIVQIITNKPKKRRNSSNSKSQPMQVDNGNDADDDTDQKHQKAEKKKKTRKRKSSETDSSAPPTKKRRTSTPPNQSTKPNKTKKGAKLKGSAAVEKVRGFMMAENRPHSKNSAQLQLGEKVISAKEVEKAMDELRNDGILVMKAFGKKSKTNIYWPDQEQFEDDADNEQDVLSRIRELEVSLKSKRGKLKANKTAIHELRQEPTDKDLDREQQVLCAKYNGLKGKLSSLEGKDKELGVQRVSKSELEAKLLEFNKYGRAWKERKAVVMDMISQMFQDSSEKPGKILTGKLNGESDKDNEVDWDRYKDLYSQSVRLVQQKKDNERKSKRMRK